ncbi:copper amine oxidase N-terminal domain-containing protein [Paenibacillus xylanilyticus]|uniref:Copper amine oxidase N-terminal domain-containing protein n=1 Tax=Paenibacillus xylanilyticus TaxID=248903 RepID=A0A7Y6BVJ6_9BACL|nr:copper amine oxidase N-terminal domain-containing protein [Paenibacillus xylanilyticus]NUU75793.1 copper amine oxidase N-terminal domain-containing protein [Paenibacillus xylanilyticus]
MKKTITLLTSLALMLATAAGTTSAKPGNTPPGQSGKEISSKAPKDKETPIEEKQTEEVESSDTVSTEEDKVKDPSTSETENTTNNTTDPTESKKKGSKGYKGLLNAIQHVEDKPAGAVLADILLTKYATELTHEQIKELEAIIEKDKALETAAEILEKNGSVTDAVYLQEEAIKSNFKNLDLYKTMGKLNEKAGKKNGVKLYVNGEASNSEPFVKKGNTFVPFRAIAESLKAEVAWNPEERSIIVTKDGVSIKLVVDSKTATVNGKNVSLDAPATITKGSTYVPVRFISEALDATVQWEEESKTVVVYEKE